MPRDTPPPIPKELMDKWYAKRRARKQAEQAEREPPEEREKKKEKEAKAPAPEPKTVYEAKPMVRNLTKEAVTAFVPTHVKMKLDKGKGQGGLMEPEEADQLEQEGYLQTTASFGDSESTRPHQVMVEEVEDEDV